MNERAILYRRMNQIPEEWGTAVNVQAMVFGNMGNTSATGVAFTRDAATGEDIFNGEYLINAQGEDVVAGVRTPNKSHSKDLAAGLHCKVYRKKNVQPNILLSKRPCPNVQKHFSKLNKNSKTTSKICKTSNLPFKMANCGYCKLVTESAPEPLW